MPTVVGVFDNKEQAERAVEEIRNAGVTDDKISIVAKEDAVKGDRNQEGANYTNQNLTSGVTSGGALGGLAGLMAGAGALTIPSIGPILAVGPLAAGLTGAAVGGVAGGLVDMGVPQERGEYYENEVKRGSILAAVKADQEVVNDAASYLRKNGARDVETH
ncbi:general stress protein [Halothermothrix orenii]|uniref:General stress protein 17M-like domain-containing protein n=1 Tax=Halothermothrix orenii (strain H 168 / OCM 544 / DSM 9562) TaxID=373903 RepID=B8CW87_HALOH|nr:general stress protein [Halothermothrix orenii]ACL69556.1 hypothetical protein Hore_07990 [Halothermothrix orenii H 168]